MSDLAELYQEVIIDHGRNPRHFAPMENPTCCAHGKNPLCGDEITIFLDIENNIIQKATFQGSGCAICTASASLMLDNLQEKTKKTAMDLFNTFISLLVEDKADNNLLNLGKLAILQGVKSYPMRVKCATLAWHTLKNALDNNLNTATTEK